MQFQNYMWMMKEARAAYRLVSSSAPRLSPHSLCSGQALSRSEGSVALGSEMLRGVDPECNAWAQQDRAITYSDGRITVFICMIGPQWAFLYPDYFVNLHYCAHRRFIGPRWLFCYSDEKVNLH
jgi:hypothetical protein